MKHVVLLCLLITGLESAFAYWPGKWSITDSYLSKNSSKKPHTILSVKKNSEIVFSKLFYDALGRIQKEEYFKNKQMTGYSIYSYGDDLKELKNYSADNKLESALSYTYKNGCIDTIRLWEKNVESEMQVECLHGRIQQAKVIDHEGRETDKIKMLYKDGQLREVHYFAPGKKIPDKIITYLYRNRILVEKKLSQQNNSVKSTIEYAGEIPVKITYFDKKNSPEKILQLQY